MEGTSNTSVGWVVGVLSDSCCAAAVGVAGADFSSESLRLAFPPVLLVAGLERHRPPANEVLPRPARPTSRKTAHQSFRPATRAALAAPPVLVPCSCSQID